MQPGTEVLRTKPGDFSQVEDCVQSPALPYPYQNMVLVRVVLLRIDLDRGLAISFSFIKLAELQQGISQIVVGEVADSICRCAKHEFPTGDRPPALEARWRSPMDNPAQRHRDRSG